MPTYYSAIYVANAGANGNVIAGNYIGTNAAGGGALGNGAPESTLPAERKTRIDRR